jgi:hypothetical protein
MLKRYTVHTTGGEHFDIDASGFAVNSANGTIEFSGVESKTLLYTVFLHGVAYIAEPAPQAANAPKEADRYGSRSPR